MPVDHTKNIIEVRDVSFSYGNEEVLTHVNLNVHMGDYLGIIGPNSGGKTTLLKIMLNLLTPSKGFVQLFGQDINSFKDWSKIGYVPQKATNFDSNFPATVEEVVLMGRTAKRGLFHSFTKEDKEAARTALEHVEMWQHKKTLIGTLSGGQQQRVFIARALASNPEVIILDEPTVGVDTKTQEQFYSLLKKLNKELDLTLVLVSHDMNIIVKETTEVAHVNKKLEYHPNPKEFILHNHA